MESVAATVFVVVGLAWVVYMVLAMIGIMQLAPKGQKLRAYHQLSMWKFAEIRSDLGAAAEPHLRTMRRGAIAFLVLFAVVIAIAIVSIVISSMNPATQP